MADSITTLLGDQLPPPPMAGDVRERLEAQLAEAQEAARAQPDSPDALIWAGRRLAYLGRYNDALQVFTDGIARWPDDPRIYRHRGHRFITLRRFPEAAANLERAVLLMEGRPDEVEPDGAPNARGIPTSTLHTNVWYHLALSRYLQGDFGRALTAWQSCLTASGNDDMRVAAGHWLYMTLRRLGREEDAAATLAPFGPEMDVIENGAYHRLLLLYKQSIKPEDLLATPENSSAAMHDSTAGYGIGNWHLYNGRDDEALEWFRRVYAGPQWAAFGFIAAEAELARRAAA